MRYNIKRAIILIYLINSFPLFAKLKNIYPPSNVQVKIHRGYIADNSYEYVNLIKNYVTPFEINISHLANGNKNWHSIYNFPEQGISFKYINLQNKEQLGCIFTIIPYINFPLIQRSGFSLFFRPALGPAYVTKIYHRTDNYKNILFSKHLNFSFEFSLEAKYKINEKLSVNAGPSYFHVSNGETKTPNEGININSFFLGFNYNFFKNKSLQIKKFEEANKKSIYFSFYPTIGYRETIPYEGDKYLTLSLTSEISREINKKQVLGIGFSFFYDETKKFFTKRNQEPVENNINAVVGGIQLSHELNLAPLYIIFQMGTIIVNTKAVSGTKIYNRMGVRYFFTKNLFFTFTHKSRFFFYGDNIEWGIGYRFIK